MHAKQTKLVARVRISKPNAHEQSRTRVIQKRRQLRLSQHILERASAHTADRVICGTNRPKQRQVSARHRYMFAKHLHARDKWHSCDDASTAARDIAPSSPIALSERIGHVQAHAHTHTHIITIKHTPRTRSDASDPRKFYTPHGLPQRRCLLRTNIQLRSTCCRLNS